MGWFDEQIRQRKQNDQDVFEDSIFRMASVVLEKGNAVRLEDEHLVSKVAIDEILKYYHFKPTEIPDTADELDEQLEYCLHPHGIMRRPVRLEENWYREGFSPMLAFRKEDGLAVALLPRNLFSGYWFHDPATGEYVRVNQTTAQLFRPDAICFYRPLPQKKLGISDLLLYLKSCLNATDYVSIVGLTFLATLVGMIIPRVTKALTGFVLENGNLEILMGTAIYIVSITISSLLIGAVRSLAMNRMQIKTSQSLEAATMDRVMNLPPRFFREYSSGELSSRIGSVSQLCNLLLGNVFSMGLSSLISLLYIVEIFHYAPALVVPALSIILLTVGISAITTLMQRKVTKQTLELSAKEKGLSFALINGIQKIKLAGAEKRAFSRWADSYADSAELTYDPPLLLKIGSVITTAITLAGTILLYYLAVQNHVAPSDYIAFNAAYGAVTAAFGALTGAALTIAQIRPIMEMAEPILKTEPESSENKEMVTKLSGSIEMSNVYFRYNDSMPYVVDGMNLKIRAGEYIAIVGTTGCGKSTLMRLLLGFETPEKGAIYYDGKDMSKLDFRSLRRRIGTVTQDGKLFPGDIYSNIVISAPQLSPDDAWEAAELAGIADDIRAMPMGMNTIISEGYGGISGGQRQRLMIARAVAPKPKILMFDEATSALDNKTQKQVSDALDHLNCTRIVIAHRLSTIKNCDRILVLDKGHIVEDGTYDELIAENGFFAELVARQRLDVGTNP